MTAHTLATLDFGAPSDDLAPLAEIVGDARIVGLGETGHGQHEFYLLRNRIVRFLIEELGFDGFLMESSLSEGVAVDEWLRTGDGDLRKLLRSGFTYTMAACEEMATLLTWMRERNARGASLCYWGIDSIAAMQTPRPGLERVWQFLGRVDPVLLEHFRGVIEPVVERFEDAEHSKALDKYRALPQPDRDALTAACADLVLIIDDREVEWLRVITPGEFAVARQHAEMVRQFDDLFRNWARAPAGGTAPATAARSVRDRYMADNVAWIMDRLGPHARVALLAHNGHLARIPLQPVGEGIPEVPEMTMLGGFLDARYGPEYLPVALTSRTGTSAYGGDLGEAPSGSLDEFMSRFGPGPTVLDLRSGDVNLDGVDHVRLVPVHARFTPDAFDAVAHVDSVRPYDALQD